MAKKCTYLVILFQLKPTAFAPSPPIYHTYTTALTWYTQNWSQTWSINHVLLPPLITLDLAYLHLDTKTHSPRGNQNHLSLTYIVHTKTSSHLSAIPYFLTPTQAQTKILPCAPTHSILHVSGLWESSFMR